MIVLIRLVAAVPFLVYSTSSLAIYKCQENGKTIYSDAQCANGKVTAIETTNSRVSESALNEAAARIKRQKETLKHLEDARRKDEAAEEKAHLKKMQASDALRKKCQAMALKTKWTDEDAAAANGKSAEKAKRVALRQKEKYQAECGRQ